MDNLDKKNFLEVGDTVMGKFVLQKSIRLNCVKMSVKNMVLLSINVG